MAKINADVSVIYSSLKGYVLVCMLYDNIFYIVWEHKSSVQRLTIFSPIKIQGHFVKDILSICLRLRGWIHIKVSRMNNDDAWIKKLFGFSNAINFNQSYYRVMKL